MTRRTFLTRSALTAAAAAGAGVVGMRWEKTATVRRLRVTGPDLPRLRLAFVSDLHRSEFVSRARIDRVAEQVAEARPDVLILGGDLATARDGRRADIDDVLAAFGAVPVGLARIAVPGNHDLALADGGDPFPSAREHDVEVLRNQGLRITDRHGRLWIAGLDDERWGTPDPDAALDGRTDEAVCALAHNPDTFARHWPESVPLTLGLAGHLHGGQVRLPGVGALVLPTEYPRYFDQGWADWPGGPVWVSRGIGEVSLPVRVLCRPEIVVADLAPGAERHVAS